jgi:hypothetical protein
MKEVKQLENSIHRKYLQNKQRKMNPSSKQLSLKKLNDDLKVTEKLKMHLIQTKQTAKKKTGFYYETKYRQEHDNVKKSGLLNLDGFSTNRSKMFRSVKGCHSKMGSMTSRDMTKKISAFRLYKKEGKNSSLSGSGHHAFLSDRGGNRTPSLKGHMF